LFNCTHDKGWIYIMYNSSLQYSVNGTWPEIKTKITLKFNNFSDEQGLQNNFNCKYLYNSKMVVKFLTKLVGNVLFNCTHDKGWIYIMYNSSLQYSVNEMADANSDRIVGVELKRQNYR
jgi:hypothetical protein